MKENKINLCRNCGETILKKRAGAEFCGPSCKNEYHNRMAKIRKTETEGKVKFLEQEVIELKKDNSELPKQKNIERSNQPVQQNAPISMQPQKRRKLLNPVRKIQKPSQVQPIAEIEEVKNSELKKTTKLFWGFFG